METLEVTASPEEICEQATHYIDIGSYEVARMLLEVVAAMVPTNADLDLQHARLALADGAWDRAIATLNESISANPLQTKLRSCRAGALLRLGDHEGAARDAAEVLFLAPDDNPAKSILGRALFEMGRHEDGIACLTEVLTADPLHIGNRESLAAMLEKIGQVDAALLTLTRGIRLIPASVSLRNMAILICMRRRDFFRAQQLAEAARRVGIVDASTFGMQGHALTSLGRIKEAEDAYYCAFKLGPQDPYLRHLVASYGFLHPNKRASEGFIKTAFDDYAERFDEHLTALNYAVPAAINAMLARHPKIKIGLPVGPVLDLGCGTGLVAKALSNLPVGPLTGIDLSPRMLDRARATELYAELREADIAPDLEAQTDFWPLIIAADVICYFGALDDLLATIFRRMEEGGMFIFSLEELLPDHGGAMPGNGKWALRRQGRYAHTEDYATQAIYEAGFRILRRNKLSLRNEAGAPVSGFLLAIARRDTPHIEI